jgi:transcriptional regulator with XRE-family HTH domain
MRWIIQDVSCESVEVTARNPQTFGVGKPRREVDPFRDELRTLRHALGRRIRDLRSSRGWSQEEFADKAHVHRTFAGSLERGEKNSSFHSLILIARCFDMTLADLFAGLEAGDSGPSSAPKRGRAPVLDRSRILTEAANLEQSAQTLRGIALAQTRPPSRSPRPKKQR